MEILNKREELFLISVEMYVHQYFVQPIWHAEQFLFHFQMDLFLNKFFR